MSLGIGIFVAGVVGMAQITRMQRDQLDARIDADFSRLEAAFSPHWATLSTQAEAEGQLVELDAAARQQLGTGDSRVYLGWCAAEGSNPINKAFVVVLRYGESGQDFQYSPDLVSFGLNIWPAGCGGHYTFGESRGAFSDGWHTLSAGSFARNTLGSRTPPVMAMVE